MRGAIVFLVVFFLVFLATIAYADLPPGKQIYGMLNVPNTDYQVLGIPATTLIVAVFNGVIYGIVVWLIYSIAARMRKPKSKPQK
jgi:cbb3-type cytochrome oxidase subunit 3